MNVRDALIGRHSVRAYLDQPVEQETVKRILDAARHAPSGVNTQPWQVAVVTGESKQSLQQQMEAAFASGDLGEMDYQYYPLTWKEPYKSRRHACSLQLYSALDIAREDKDRRRQQWVANYRSFDAPVVLYFFMDSVMETGSYLDYGMFIQSVMLAAVEEGLASCPQGALAQYPKIVKQGLGYADDQILICGMALGYEDTTAEVNSYRTPRDEVAEFSRFFG